MVYAPYGRAGVYMLQEYCRRLGIGWTEAEIRDLAASLKALPADHPIVPLLRTSPDFSNTAGLADALLHPRDRAYDVPQFINSSSWRIRLRAVGGPSTLSSVVRSAGLDAARSQAGSTYT